MRNIRANFTKVFVCLLRGARRSGGAVGLVVGFVWVFLNCAASRRRVSIWQMRDVCVSTMAGIVCQRIRRTDVAGRQHTKIVAHGASGFRKIGDEIGLNYIKCHGFYCKSYRLVLSIN